MDKIDFVITWVDGDDPKWKAEKRSFEGKELLNGTSDDSNSECRYRADAVLLRYWFRAVEQYAPWVNKIHFVTCGQKPEWLNESHPKLDLVNHKDYIPSAYLPTFNSNAIELNYHRMPGLSEKFVLFNDDMFLLHQVNPEFFFRDGNPVLDADLRYTNKVGYNNWSRVLFNNYCVVNKSFDIGKSIWECRKKWFNVSALGFKRSKRNFICYLANKTLPVSLYGHIALPHLKSSFQELWMRHPDILEQTSVHKFRTDDQVNHWLLCAWNQAKGRFSPARENKLGRNVSINPNNLKWVCGLIKNQEIPQICINDTSQNSNPDLCSKELIDAFNSILPNQSQFEKY